MERAQDGTTFFGVLCFDGRSTRSRAGVWHPVDKPGNASEMGQLGGFRGLPRAGLAQDRTAENTARRSLPSPTMTHDGSDDRPGNRRYFVARSEATENAPSKMRLGFAASSTPRVVLLRCSSDSPPVASLPMRRSAESSSSNIFLSAKRCIEGGGRERQMRSRIEGAYSS